MSFRMNQKVHIKSIKSSDGIPQMGVVIGIIKIKGNCYLSYDSFRQYLNNLSAFEYIVAYQRKSGGFDRIFTETYQEKDLEKWST